MKIGIEAQRLFRAHKHGMDRVALELIRNLQLIDKENQYFIFVKPDIDNRVISETENFKIVEIKGFSYPIWEQFKLPRVAKAYNCDILHCTSNTAPLQLKFPQITTLHDVIFNEFNFLQLLFSKASWYQKLGNLYRKLILKKVVRASRRLITVSNSERQNIKRLFNLEDDKIKTIYNGVNRNFRIINDKCRKEEVRQTYHLLFPSVCCILL